jgi:hypothetical protein
MVIPHPFLGTMHQLRLLGIVLPPRGHSSSFMGVKDQWGGEKMSRGLAYSGDIVVYVVGRCFPCAMYVQDATTVNDAVAERWSVVLQSGAKANDPPLLRRVPLRP